MPLRDIVLSLIIVGSLPFILSRPYIGVLVWSWISYMNPHRLTWAFAYALPWAQIVALTLFVSLLFNQKELRKPPMYPVTWVWLAFIAWMFITTAAGLRPGVSFVELVDVMKIQLIIFLTMMIMRTPERLNMMIWVIFLSVGFYGIKGGIFTLLSGGAHRVYGPAQSVLRENNALAISLLIILPLGYYLFRHASNVWIRRGLLVAIGLIAISVVGSQSRGALVAIVAVAGFLWAKSRNKLLIGVLVFAALPLVFISMPASWHERMSTIETYEEDPSAMSRLNSWQYAINVANDRLTGVGFNGWNATNFARWAPDPKRVFVAHSIYFHVLGDHGWIGLLLFLAIFLGIWRMNSRIIGATSGDPQHHWMADLSRMIQVSLVAYAVGGAFLSLSYFDLPWHIAAITLIMRAILEESGGSLNPTPGPQAGRALRQAVK
jgi:probable O-glycosylation ligase (exosortase A-associated)